MLEGARFSQKMLDIGFGAALVLASLCLLMSAWYLFRFLSATNTGIAALLENPSALSTDQTVLQLAINSRVVMTRFALLSCGVFVGMAFGFLGFALFLMGIKGEMDVSAQAESFTIKIARMSPGVFVLLCAAILIGVCATHSSSFQYTQTRAPQASQAAEDAQRPAPPLDPGGDQNP
jgi:hypothetical protein